MSPVTVTAALSGVTVLSTEYRDRPVAAAVQAPGARRRAGRRAAAADSESEGPPPRPASPPESRSLPH